jgi:small-conductance mechanosensitive channel
MARLRDASPARRPGRFIALAAALWVGVIAAGPALGQAPAPGATPAPPPPAPAPAAPAPGLILADIQNRLPATTDDARLAAMEQQAAQVETGAQQAMAAGRAHQQTLAEQLHAAETPRRRRLSPAQKQAQGALAAQQALLDRQLQGQQALAGEAERVVSLVAERRREGFSGRVLQRSPSPLSPAFWSSMAGSLSGDLARLDAIGAQAMAAAGRPPPLDSAGRLGLAVLAALFVLIPLRLWLLRLRRRRRDAPAGGLRRSLASVWTLAVEFGAPTLAAALVELGAAWAGLLSADASAIAAAGVRSVGWAAAILALGRVLAADPDGRYRLLSVSDADARRIGLALWPVGIVVAAGGLIRAVLFIVGASVAATIAANCVLSLAYAAGAALILVSYRRAAQIAGAGDAVAAAARSPAWTLISLALTLAVAATVGAVFCGYTTLAALISGQMFWLGLIGGVAYLLLRLVDDVFTALFRQGGRTATALAAAFGLRRRIVMQAGLLVSAGLQVAIFALALMLALTPFGQSGELLARNVAALGGAFKVGDVAISPSAIAAGLAAFGVCMAAAHVARGWIVGRYLPVTGWDEGVRNSVAVGVGYLGVAIALVIGLAVTGLGFQQIALVASALSVGIGFGLQQVVQNFVCGVILLIERPVKVGDWVNVGGVEGDVRRIRVRATEIETFDRTTVLVPNSSLVTANVENKTLGQRNARIQVKLGIAKAGDVRKVRAAILDVACKTRGVLHEPGPAIYAEAISAGGGLALDCHVYVANPRDAYRVRSDLLLALADRLERERVALS